MAIAGAPVTSWEYYDTGYTERYMQGCIVNIFNDLILNYYKIVVSVGCTTSRGSNHLPHDPRFDVLTTTLKKGFSY